MSNLAINPLPSFTDLSGMPLQGGSLYLGVANANPQTNPVTAFQDEACKIALDQPIRIQNGVPTLNGTPLTVYLQTPVYSILVNDNSGRVVYTLPSVSAALPNTAQAGSRTDYPSAGQVQDNAFNVLNTIGGTGDVITADAPLGLSALAVDSEYTFTPTATNTTATPTLSINGITPYTIIDSQGGALVPGALQVGVPYKLLFDGFNLRVIGGTLANQSPTQQASISFSTNSNALTLNYAGGALAFRNPTQANGVPVGLQIGPLSITIPSGATLGMINGVNATLVRAVAYNNGTPVMMVAKKTPLLDCSETGLVSPTLISSGATLEGVWYSAAPVAANSPYKIIGIDSINEATAGIYVNGPYEQQGIGGLAFMAIMSLWAPQQQSITSSVASGALTITYTPNGPLQFRNPTLTNGAPVVAAMASGPLSITVPQGATLGIPAGVPANIAVAVNWNGGSPVLQIVNQAAGIQWDGDNLVSPTAISTGSTSANTIYSASAVAANSPYSPVGVISMPGQTTAGTWATGQTQAQGASASNSVAMGTHGLINNTNATSDLALAVGQGSYIDVVSATSIPLHTATGDNQEHEISLAVSYQVNDTGTFLLPNNTTYTNQFNSEASYAIAATPEASNLTENAFRISNGQAHTANCVVKTKTSMKVVISTYRGAATTGISSGVVSSVMTTVSSTIPDTTTLITSLGTLTFGTAVTGRIIMRRKA